MSEHCANYVTSKLFIAEQQMDAAHAVLDEKKVPRRLAGHNTLTIAQRIILSMGETLPEIYRDDPQFDGPG